jgi:hypothetical protein
MSRDPRPPVTADECDAMNERLAQGVTQYTIAEEFDRSQAAITYHINGKCEHHKQVPSYPDSPEQAIEGLHELAESVGRIPKQGDWATWDNKPCRVRGVRVEFDGWENALEAAGFPAIPSQSPDKVRELAYQKPALSDPFAEQEQKIKNHQ